MKIRFFITVLALITLHSCSRSYTYVIASKVKNINEDFAFIITRVHEGTRDYRFVAKKGSKIIKLDFEFYNKSRERIEMKFDDIYLVDLANKTKYTNIVVRRPGGAEFTSRSSIEINPDQTRRISVTFVVRSGFRPENIVINEQLFTIDLMDDKTHQPF